jgi:hypothetical protein
MHCMRASPARLRTRTCRVPNGRLLQQTQCQCDLSTRARHSCVVARMARAVEGGALDDVRVGRVVVCS